MHKLVLGSGGIFFENAEDPIINHIISMVDDKTDMKAVFLPTACHDSHDDEQTVRNYFISHGFSECVSLYLSEETTTDEYIREKIEGASVIYADGGNLKFLLETWRKRNVIPLLREAYDRGVVIAGQSSGAMCWCRTGYDNCGLDGRFMFLHGLDFIPYILCPHFEDWQHFLENVKMQELSGLAVDNDIAIAITDGEITVVDSGRNAKHSAFYLPAEDEYRVHDLQKEKISVPNLK